MVKKHFFIDVIIYGLPPIVSRGIGFLLLPIYTRYLSPEDYGVLEMITALYVLLNLTLPLEIKQAVARFIPEQNNIEDKARIASTAYWFTFLLFSLFALMAFMMPTTLSRTCRIRININSGRSGFENLGNGVGDRHIHISIIIKNTATVLYTAVVSLHHDLKLLPK